MASSDVVEVQQIVSDAAPVPVPVASPVPAPAPAPARLTCVDVFSGIGGITLGIAPFAQALQYCDLEKYCQSVLLQRMGEGQIEKAPIHTDIRNLHIASVVNPDMICGGFPCQDISSIGLQRGIVNGERSSMFYEVMRIVDSKPSIKVVFLENVANILNCGIKEVVDELSGRGFSLQWTLRSAISHGAPHVRNRWFCLACRGDGAARVHEIVAAYSAEGAARPADPLVGHAWTAEPKLRVSFRPAARADTTYDDHWANRCQALGNAVVPCIVRSAFIELALASRRWPQYVELLSDTGVPIGDLKYPYSDSAIVSGGLLYNVPKRRMVPVKHTVEILSPGGAKSNGDYVRFENYPTPRRGITHASTLTERSIRDLPTILVYCKQTADYLAELAFVAPEDKQLHSLLIPNVNYLEWMMGYPADWTRIEHGSGGAIPMPPSRAAVSRAAAQARLAAGEDGEDAEVGSADDSAEHSVDDEDAAASAAGPAAGEGGKKTRARSARPKPAADADGAKKPQRLHGMHMYMREHTGMDVPTVAKLWKALSDEERASYSLKAKQLAAGGAAPQEAEATPVEA